MAENSLPQAEKDQNQKAPMTVNHITNNGVTALCGATLSWPPAPASAPWCTTCMERDA